MYFNPETYKVVEQLEKDGELEKAWKILHEEWMPEQKKDSIRKILMDCVDNFEVMNKEMEPMR